MKQLLRALAATLLAAALAFPTAAADTVDTLPSDWVIPIRAGGQVTGYYVIPQGGQPLTLTVSGSEFSGYRLRSGPLYGDPIPLTPGERRTVRSAAAIRLDKRELTAPTRDIQRDYTALADELRAGFARGEYGDELFYIALCDGEGFLYDYLLYSAQDGAVLRCILFRGHDDSIWAQRSLRAQEWRDFRAYVDTRLVDYLSSSWESDNDDIDVYQYLHLTGGEEAAFYVYDPLPGSEQAAFLRMLEELAGRDGMRSDLVYRYRPEWFVRAA